MHQQGAHLFLLLFSLKHLPARRAQPSFGRRVSRSVSLVRARGRRWLDALPQGTPESPIGIKAHRANRQRKPARTPRHFLAMNKNAVTREIMRLELQSARLVGRIKD